jgi:hypothetical protein
MTYTFISFFAARRRFSPIIKLIRFKLDDFLPICTALGNRQEMSGSGIYGFVKHSARTSVFPQFKSSIEFILNPEPNPFAFRGLQPNLAQLFNIVIWVNEL